MSKKHQDPKSILTEPMPSVPKMAAQLYLNAIKARASIEYLQFATWEEIAKHAKLKFWGKGEHDGAVDALEWLESIGAVESNPTRTCLRNVPSVALPNNVPVSYFTEQFEDEEPNVAQAI